MKIIDLRSALSKASFIIEKLDELNIQFYPGSRFYKHRELIDNCLPVLTNPKSGQIEHLGGALFDINELYFILRHLFNKKNSRSKDHGKIKQLLKGCCQARDDKNSHPRNIQYELFIGALFHSAGLNINLCEPDIKCKSQNLEFTIAAKRVKSNQQVKKRTKEGSHQITNQQLPGIIALSFEQIANPEQLPFDLKTFHKESANQIDGFLKRHNEIFPLKIDGIAGILLTSWAWALPKSMIKDPDKGSELAKLPIRVGWNFKFLPPANSIPSFFKIKKVVNFTCTKLQI